MRAPPFWLAEFLHSLERSAFAEAVRTTSYVYPTLMSLHVLGIAMLVGGALAMDMRLLGMGRGNLPVTSLVRFLFPVSLAGFALIVITGIPMFMAVAVSVGASIAAPWKLALVILAGINVLVFYVSTYPSVKQWDVRATPPWPAKVAAGISAVTWTLVIFAGRFLAY